MHLYLDLNIQETSSESQITRCRLYLTPVYNMDGTSNKDGWISEVVNAIVLITL